MEVPLTQDRARWDALRGETKAAKAAIAHRRESGRADFAAWLDAASADEFAAKVPKDIPVVHAMLDDNQARTLKVSLRGKTSDISLTTNAAWRDGVLAAKAFATSAATTPVLPDAGDFEKDQPRSYGAWVYLTGGMDGALFARMDNDHDYRGWDFWLQGGKPATHIISKWPDDALKVVSQQAIPANRWTHVWVTYDGSAKVSGVKIFIDGKQQETTTEADKLSGTIRTKVPFKIGQRNTASAVEGVGLQDLRIYDRVLKPGEVQSLFRDTRLAWLLSTPRAKLADKQKDELYEDWLVEIDSEYPKATAALAALEKERAEIKARGTEALVMQDKTNAPVAYVLYRGDYEQRRDKVTPITPAALPPMPADFPHNRLGFAKWLFLPDQPLPARVTVNRFWQEIFGVGPRQDFGRFRRDRRTALQPAAPGLAGGRFPRIGLGHQTLFQASGHVGGVSAIGRADAG